MPTDRNGVGHVRYRRTRETILDQAGADATTTLPPMRRRATTDFAWIALDGCDTQARKRARAKGPFE